MNKRTKDLWLPALMTLWGASTSLALFQYLGARPHPVWVGNVALTFYWAGSPLYPSLRDGCLPVQTCSMFSLGGADRRRGARSRNAHRDVFNPAPGTGN